MIDKNNKESTIDWRVLWHVHTKCALALTLLCAGTAQAASAYSREDLRHLADLSLEELMNESITSVSKKDQKLGDAAAAITVISAEDLRRSGATQLVDALRLVPGMNVGAYNANQWAVSARGFNNVYANKLLVLIDGRTVYTPLFSGVFWDLQQPMLEDIERIEVIRGPGATVWGANAVNGVINIITRNAAATQGELAYAGAGDRMRALAGARHGGQWGEHTAYRAFATYRHNEEFLFADGNAAHDHWRTWSSGFRIDHDAGAQRLTWQGDITSADSDTHSAYDLNVLGRWNGSFIADSSAELQVYYDRVYRNDQQTILNATDTFDVSLQQQWPLSDVHDLVWGGGYRLISNRLEPRSAMAQIWRRKVSQHVANAFVQDEFTLIPEHLSITGGIKLEHNDFTGSELAPSLRATYKPTYEQTLWAAVSRAFRTPSVLESTDAIALVIAAPLVASGGLYLPVLVGNDAIKSETLWAYEAGYRIQPMPRFSLDISGYYNHYDRISSIGPLRRLVPGSPIGIAEYAWSNTLRGETYGGELEAKYSPDERWRLTATYALLIVDLHGSTAEDNYQRTLSAPKHQVNLGVSHQLDARIGTDLQIRYVSAIEQVPSYLTADLQITYRLSDRLDVSLAGRNLLDGRHVEQKPLPNLVSSEVPRDLYLKLRAVF